MKPDSPAPKRRRCERIRVLQVDFSSCSVSTHGGQHGRAAGRPPTLQQSTVQQRGLRLCQAPGCKSMPTRALTPQLACTQLVILLAAALACAAGVHGERAQPVQCLGCLWCARSRLRPEQRACRRRAWDRGPRRRRRRCPRRRAQPGGGAPARQGLCAQRVRGGCGAGPADLQRR